MVKKLFILFLMFSSITVTVSLLGIQISQAQVDQGGGGTTPTCPVDSVCLPNPIPDKGSTDINVLIGQVINGVLGLVGSIALVMFIYGGFTWMLAAGSPQRVQKGKDILLWATIGLIVIFSAYALVNFILTKVLGSA